MPEKHLKIYVTGRVQGVFYRASTEEKAVSLGLAGFVRNQTDGSVYIEAEGEASQVDTLAEWCHQGPPQAKVAQVKTEEGTPKGYPGFTTR